ncbi:MAG: hypothetical protein MSC51_04020 [Mollicutes bacterium]|nr:hypothetical protein [Mollicutes bacterium]
MQYIRDYIETVTQEEKLLDPITIFGAEMPSVVYGFTNPSEFIAETFGNPKFQ